MLFFPYLMSFFGILSDFPSLFSCYYFFIVPQIFSGSTTPLDRQVAIYEISKSPLSRGFFWHWILPASLWNSTTFTMLLPGIKIMITMITKFLEIMVTMRSLIIGRSNFWIKISPPGGSHLSSETTTLYFFLAVLAVTIKGLVRVKNKQNIVWTQFDTWWPIFELN